MLSLESAQERLLASIQVFPTERISLLDAVGRFCAETVAASVDLPGFDNSAMDGYAVRAEDLARATPTSPVELRPVGRVGAGDVFQGGVARGECVRIFTGSPLPQGADAVVMQEDVTVENDRVRFVEATKPFDNVRLRGEDIRAGSPVLENGDRVSPTRAGLLAATGHGEVLVHKTPRIALLSTGSELAEPGAPLAGGKIYEGNRTLLAALLREMRAEPSIHPLVADDLQNTVAALKDGFSKSDFVITTGGVSVGEFDFVKEAFTRIGGQIEFWKIALRPGKPFLFGRLDDKFLFGLPGNPVSALVTFLLLVRPALLKAMGARYWELPRMEAQLDERIANKGDRRHFVRGRLARGKVRVAGRQSSHMIGALGDANCLIDVPAQTELEAGAITSVLLWQLPES